MARRVVGTGVGERSIARGGNFCRVQSRMSTAETRLASVGCMGATRSFPAQAGCLQPFARPLARGRAVGDGRDGSGGVAGWRRDSKARRIYSSKETHPFV